MKRDAKVMKTRMATIFSSTITLLVSADERCVCSSHQDHRQQHHNDERGPIEAEMPARGIKHISFQIGEAAGKIRWGDPSRVGIEEPNQSSRLTICWEKPTADGHVKLTAYSRMRSQPMIQAMSSPMVAYV